MNLKEEIQLRLARLSERGGISSEDREELEGHILDSAEHLENSGLSRDEALIIALRRLGTDGELIPAEMIGPVNRMWKDMIKVSVGSAEEAPSFLTAAISFFVILFSLIPSIFSRGPGTELQAYFLNVALMVVPAAGLWYVLRRSAHGIRPGKDTYLVFAALLLPLILNFYPSRDNPESQTLLLSVLHMPLGVWLVFSLLRDSAAFRQTDARLDFIRFSGEVTVYAVLVGIALLALIGFTQILFSLIDINLEPLAIDWLLPAVPPVSLFAGVVLVEKKRSVVENFAPVLAKILSVPLLLVLVGFALALIPRRDFLQVDRDLLIVMDLMLLAVVVTVVYSISARAELNNRRIEDILYLALVSVAALINLYVLTVMLYRVLQFGASANRLAVMGSNILLMGNLLILMRYFILRLKKDLPISGLLNIQGRYFFLYAFWFYFVGLIFPFIFAFR